MPGETIFPPRPLSVTVANVRYRHVVTLSLVLGGIGLAVLAAALTGGPGEPGDSGGGTTVGLVLLALALVPPVLWRMRPPPRRLLIDGDGLRWDEPGDAWAVTWRELRKVTFSYTRPDTSQPRRAPVTPPRIELVLSPADGAFRHAHPEMEHLAEDSQGEPGVVYRLRLGNVHRHVGPIDDALTAFAAGKYERDGRDVPRGLRRPWAVVLSVALASAFSVVAFGSALWPPSEGDVADAATGSFWTAVVVAWLVRVWAGGTLAIGFLRWAATFVGGAFLVVLLLTALMLGGDLDGPGPARLAFGVPLSAGLLLSGLLLKRGEVREWSEARVQGR